METLWHECGGGWQPQVCKLRGSRAVCPGAAWWRVCPAVEPLPTTQRGEHRERLCRIRLASRVGSETVGTVHTGIIMDIYRSPLERAALYQL